MTFFNAFAALGYSAIVLVVTIAFVGALVFNGLGLSKRALWVKLLFVAVLIAVLVPSTIFLADQRGMLMDSIRDEGGLKRIDTPKPQPEATD